MSENDSENSQEIDDCSKTNSNTLVIEFQKELSNELTDDDDELCTPDAVEQKRQIEKIDNDSTCSYAVSRSWYKKWEEYVGISPLHHHQQRQSIISSYPPPPPIDMDCVNDSNNEYISEEAWKRFVNWYGIDKRSHFLDRKHMYFKDEKIFDICILTPFSGITEHRVKKFNRFEEIGWIELQMRQIFQIDMQTETRLWISEKGHVPRFRQLLIRSRMLNDCIVREKTYIVAIEELNVANGHWTTGEPGYPKGSLNKYADLVKFREVKKLSGGIMDEDDSMKADNKLKELLNELSLEICQSIKTNNEKVVRKCHDILEKKQINLDKKTKKVLLKLDECHKKLKKLNSDREELEEKECQLIIKCNKVDKKEETLQKREDELNRQRIEMQSLHAIQKEKIKLEVGGHVYVTSLTTLRKKVGGGGDDNDDTLLSVMFSGEHALLADKSDGSYFIDRDGVHFRYILNFLRDSTIDLDTLPRDRLVLREILREAQYYKVKSLVDILEKFISSLNTESGSISGGGGSGVGGIKNKIIFDKGSDNFNKFNKYM